MVPRKTDVAEMLCPTVAKSSDFWRGVIDGDGCLPYKKTTKKGKLYTYNAIELDGSFGLCTQFRDFVQGITPTKASIRKDTHSPRRFRYGLAVQHATSVI